MTVNRPLRRVLTLGLLAGCVVTLAVLGLAVAQALRGADAGRAGDSDGSGPGSGGALVVCFGHVDVEQRVASLHAVQPGRLAEVLVRESEAVKSGAVLLRLEDEAHRLRAREAEAALRGAEAQLTQARTLPEHHRAQVAQQEAAVKAAQHRAAATRGELARKRELLGAGYKELESLADLLGGLEAAEQAERHKLRELQAVNPEAAVERAEAEVAACQARLGQARWAVEQCTIRAPADGVVLRILVSPGDLLGATPHQPAVLFCPDAPRVVRAEVAQEFASRVAVGQVCTVQDDNSAGRTWRARVKSVSDWFAVRRSVLHEPLQQNDVRTLECILEVEPGQPPLRIGQRVRVTIVGPLS
jgi:multidrug resistance efflux pump